MDSRVNEIIEFWIGDAEDDPDNARRRGKLWYQSTPESDENLREKFGALLEEAESGGLDAWRESVEGTLALVILLDQFSRNLYRGTAKAFANDQAALEIAYDAVNSGVDESLPYISRAFLYHPFEHAENIEAQDKSVELFTKLAETASEDWREYLAGFLEYAVEHREVVQKFGRFPHRNRVLERTNTPAEQEYLDAGAKRYGQ